MNPNTSTRNIVINWTPVQDVNAIGYNIFECFGAPPDQTQEFIAFVNGVNSSGYNTTITEGTQHQYAVYATDGTTNSAPLQIFYPNGTGIATPTTLTPDKLPMMIPRDIQYVLSSEFNQYSTGLQFVDTDPIVTSGVLDSYLKAASGAVNRMCKRYFQVQTIDEIYPAVTIGQSQYPKLMTVFLKQKPIQNVISVNLQVLKYYINVSLDYIMLEPDAGYYNLVPMLSGGYTGYPIPQFIEGMSARVWTRYTAGFDILPEEVKIATVLLATKMIALPSQNPVSAQSVKFGRNFTLQWDDKVDPIIGQVKDLLRPYMRFAWGRPSLPY